MEKNREGEQEAYRVLREHLQTRNASAPQAPYDEEAEDEADDAAEENDAAEGMAFADAMPSLMSFINNYKP